MSKNTCWKIVSVNGYDMAGLGLFITAARRFYYEPRL